MKLITIVIYTLLIINNFASASEIKYIISKKVNSDQAQVLSRVFKDISLQLPQKFIEGLPNDIEISLDKLSNHTEIPKNVCDQNLGTNDEKNKTKRFIYGEYNKILNRLTLNLAVVNELKNGAEKSFKISCQHGSLYNQSVSTIIHELSHAYDMNNDKVSSTFEFLRRAGFKNGLLKIKNKNTSGMRSADPYELVNVQEAFAVNFEYFILDEEYACRRPSMFDFYKGLFGNDPFPKRNCKLNKTVMLSTSQGFFPYNIDPARIYRIDYLLASPGKELSSGFGHSMFRLVVCAPERFDLITQKTIAATPFGKKCLEDKLYHVVVSYRANVEDATLNYIKGLTGGYPSMLFILNFGDVLDEYNKDELRDVYAHPLLLAESEKNDVVKKIIEEHWNYRGDYKFITNNCAVESFDLLKASLNRPQIKQEKALTPNGVLKDLDHIELLDIKSSEIETYKAKSDQLIESMKLAYGLKSKNIKDDKKFVMKFIDESKVQDRKMKFYAFSNSAIIKTDAHGDLLELKRRLIKASSFSVLEQQILRTTGARFRKKAADLYFNTKDEELKSKLEKISKVMKSSLYDFSNSGYGVPLIGEMVPATDIAVKTESSKGAMREIEEIFKSLMPEEFETLNAISSNIILMNEKAIKVRKEYRSQVEVYINHVLINMRSNDDTLQILIAVKSGNQNSIKELRNLLDPTIVSEKEILDAKLIKIVSTILE